MTCPRCRRKQYFVCRNRRCSCRRIPKGKRAMRWRRGDVLACTYCGYAEHSDWWEERDLKEASKAWSVSEALEVGR